MLLLDGDEAGRQRTSAITDMLADRIVVAVVTLQDATQPGQLTSRD